MTNLAFDFCSPGSHSRSGHDAIIAVPASKRSETTPDISEDVSKRVRSVENSGEDRYSALSPQKLARDLAAHLAPGQPAKVCIPALHRALVKHVGSLTLRRVRTIFNGETARVWSDERDALRAELIAAENAAARRAFARAAVELQCRLANSGAPLTESQAAALREAART